MIEAAELAMMELDWHTTTRSGATVELATTADGYRYQLHHLTMTPIRGEAPVPNGFRIEVHHGLYVLHDATRWFLTREEAARYATIHYNYDV